MDKKEYDKAYYKNNCEKKLKRERERYYKNREKVLEERKQYRLDNMKKFKEKDVQYYENNREKILEQKKEYREKNKDKIKEFRLAYKTHLSAYYKNKYYSDNLYRLSHCVRSLIRGSLKCNGYSKSSKTQDILGCSFEEFKTYLESKFESWMNWSNYGNWNGHPKEINIAWDIDHIIPMTIAKTEEDVLQLNHYTNLQPLCSYTNRHIKAGNISVINN